MNLSPVLLSFVIAIFTSAISTTVLSLEEDISNSSLIISFIVSFFSSFMVVFVLFRFLFYREVNKIHSLLKKLKDQDFTFIESPKSDSFNLLEDINQEIFTYAKIKQNEIDNLKKVEKFRREFIANISHEFKTPIFAAQGFVHTLLDGAIDDKSVRSKFLKKAAKSLDGLDVLVQDLLILSRIETGEIKMNYEYFNINHVIEEIIEQFEVKASRKDINLIMKANSKNIQVFADSRRIHQVLNNLVSNALNYTNEGGEVSIVLSKKENGVEVMVKDTGIGIPTKDISRVFERFYRVEKSRSRAGGGTGLGLAIVKHILEGHGVQIMVESIPDVGSKFRFILPHREK